VEWQGIRKHIGYPKDIAHEQKPVYSGNLAPVDGLRHTQSHLALSKATWWRLKLIMSADRMEAWCLEWCTSFDWFDGLSGNSDRNLAVGGRWTWTAKSD
jgi:hypothetical protein